MDWFVSSDRTAPVFTAREHIFSSHGAKREVPTLPETAMLFYMHGGVEYLREKHGCPLLSEKLPRFLQGCPVYSLNGSICFLDGGRGAPQAADTVETLAALGVRRIISIGMFGAFGDGVETGESVVPKRALIEEGTSHHYFENPEYAYPDGMLSKRLAALTGAARADIVSTDAVYRQTYFKERLWREKGAVGVDMETSAVFSVSKYLGISAAALLMASDKHPSEENAGRWEWRMTKRMRLELFERAEAAASFIANEQA